jgi:hypothetical protein
MINTRAKDTHYKWFSGNYFDVVLTGMSILSILRKNEPAGSEQIRFLSYKTIF